MNKKKILFALLSVYVIGLHVIIFFLYFDKVEFKEFSHPQILPILSELETGLYAESDSVFFDYALGDNSISVRKKISVGFDLVDSVAILSEEYRTFTSVFFFSSKHNFFFGHASETKFYSTRFLIRGNCLILPEDTINEYTDIDTQKAAQRRERANYPQCSFKPTDAPENIFIFEKDQKVLKLYPR